jgi:hypothetical protein
MANQVKTISKGNSGVDHSGPNNKTPAPTQAPRIRFSDDFGGKGDLNYGRNRQNLPASVEPGATVESDLAKDLRTSVDDPALATVIAKGTARRVNTLDTTGRTLAQQGGDGLLRDLAAGGTGHGVKGRPSPVHPSMAPRSVAEGSPGGPVPGAIDKSATADPVRKPGA